MANIQALADIKRWTAALETVRDVKSFMDDRKDRAETEISLAISGQALPGHHEYKAMLREELEAVLPELNQKIRNRLVARERDAKDQIAKAAPRL